MKFGPSGNSDIFYDQGYKNTYEAPKWLHDMGLTAFEYSFGRGVLLKDEGAQKIKEEADKNNIAVSAHAPYFINLANSEEEKREKSYTYILDSAKRVKQLGGNRVIMHVGAQLKMQREEALHNCALGMVEAYKRMDDAGLSDVHLCPETMGKKSQIGDLTETLQFCLLDERFIPCIDFAHLHALHQGALNTQEDFKKILDEMENTIGIERARKMHVHFSTIEFTQAGEKRHRTFEETAYGPRFELLAPLLYERKYDAVIICESKGTMAQDALFMKNEYEKYGV